MRYKKLVAFPVLALSALALIVAASADEKIGFYNLIDTISSPGISLGASTSVGSIPPPRDTTSLRAPPLRIPVAST